MGANPAPASVAPQIDGGHASRYTGTARSSISRSSKRFHPPPAAVPPPAPPTRHDRRAGSGRRSGGRSSSPGTSALTSLGTLLGRRNRRHRQVDAARARLSRRRPNVAGATATSSPWNSRACNVACERPRAAPRPRRSRARARRARRSGRSSATRIGNRRLVHQRTGEVARDIAAVRRSTDQRSVISPRKRPGPITSSPGVVVQHCHGRSLPERMRLMPCALGVDVGTTNLKVALVRDDATVDRRRAAGAADRARARHRRAGRGRDVGSARRRGARGHRRASRRGRRRRRDRRCAASTRRSCPIDARRRARRADADVAGPARHRPLASTS